MTFAEEFSIQYMFNNGQIGEENIVHHLTHLVSVKYVIPFLSS